MQTGAALGMKADDRELDDASVLALVRQYIPGARAITHIYGGGRKGQAYLIDDAVVVKVQRPTRLRPRPVEEFETNLQKEAFLLRQMSVADGIAAPHLLGSGTWQGTDYVCMTRMNGASLRQAALTANQRSTVLNDLGKTLHRIHRLPLDLFRDSRLFPIDSSAADVRARVEGTMIRLVGAIRLQQCPWPIDVAPETVAARVLEALPSSDQLAVLHSNPAPEHVYVDPQTAAFQGLIDFGDAYISHPAFDLRPWRDPADTHPLIEGYQSEGPVDDAFIVTWRVGMMVAELGALVRGRDGSGPAAELLSHLLMEL